MAAWMRTDLNMLSQMTWTPPQDLTALMFSIAVAFISWPIQPMAMHRVMVARDGKAVKAACASFMGFPMVIFLPVIVMGFLVAAEWPGTNMNYAFMTTMGEFIKIGGFPAVIAVMFMCSAIAAFMSTSDSIVLAISNNITVDLLKNWLFPTQSITFYLIASKLISCATIALGIYIGLYSGMEIWEFVNIAQGFMNCVLAPYYVGTHKFI